MYSTNLFALRRCLEFGRLGEHPEGLCAVVELSPAGSPAGAWLVLPASSPAAVRALPGLCVRELPCTPLPRRGRWPSGDRGGVVGRHCAFAVSPPTACCSCVDLGIALVCAGPQHASWNLKVSLTPSLHGSPRHVARRQFRACRRGVCYATPAWRWSLPSRGRLGSLRVLACAPRLAERLSGILKRPLLTYSRQKFIQPQLVGLCLRPQFPQSPTHSPI